MKIVRITCFLYLLSNTIQPVFSQAFLEVNHFYSIWNYKVQLFPFTPDQFFLYAGNDTSCYTNGSFFIANDNEIRMRYLHNHCNRDGQFFQLDENNPLVKFNIIPNDRSSNESEFLRRYYIKDSLLIPYYFIVYEKSPILWGKDTIIYQFETKEISVGLTLYPTDLFLLKVTDQLNSHRLIGTYQKIGNEIYLSSESKNLGLLKLITKSGKLVLIDNFLVGETNLRGIGENRKSYLYLHKKT